MNYEIITSRNNQLVKWAASLLDKKGRQKSEAFIVEGIKLSLEAISSALPVVNVFISEDKASDILPILETSLEGWNREIPKVCLLSREAFEKITTEKAPQGIVTVIKYLDFFSNIDIIYKEDFFLAQEESAIALYSVRDPSNLGAIIRTAAAFGIDHIILSNDCADLYNPKTVRSSMGGIFKVKTTRVSSFEKFIDALSFNGRRSFAAELRENSIPLGNLSLSPSDVFVIGNEGHGIPSEISSLCDKSIFIPISPDTESLNASVAASILMWEISKVR